MSAKKELYQLKGAKTTATQSSKTTTKFVSQEEINDAHRDLAAEFGGKKEDYFGAVYISKKFNIPLKSAAPLVALGGTDYGIEAFYHDNNEKSLYLFTFKWSEDHMSFKDPLDKLGGSGMYKIFFDPTLPEDHPMIASLKLCLRQNSNLIDRIFINFVFNGDPVDAEQSKVLSFLRENVEDKRSLVDSYLTHRNAYHQTGKQHELIFQYVSNEDALGSVTSSRQSMEYTLEFSDSLKISGNKNELMVVLLPLGNLYQMYSDLGERFFEKNLRSGLDDGNMTNSQIKKTLKRIVDGEEQPENFALHHNGVTLTAQVLEANGHSVRMVEPRVLNGAQTVRILRQFVDGMAKNNKSQQQLVGTTVMARIIRSSDDEFLKQVAINNNRQNPIMPWNLRANDLVQIGFEELFSKLGIYYERRENAYKNLTDEDLEAGGAEKGVVEIRKFAQTLLAMQGQLDRISETKEVFENEGWYRDAFKEQYLQADPRKLILLYKVQYRLQSLIREIRNVGNEKYGYAPKAKNLLWCLLIQGIMNDSRFDKYVEHYGTSTAVEAGITELLKSMATTKLRFILGDAFEEKKYLDNINGGKFSFLTSRAAFTDCMEAAAVRFKWEKKSL